MIVHILLVDAGADVSPAREQEILDAIESLGQVPGVQQLTCGRDFSGRGKGYTIAGVMHFAGQDELAAYAKDSLHLKVVETLIGLQVQRLVIDYETVTSGIST